MSARIVDGRAVAAAVTAEVAAELAEFTRGGAQAPGLDVVLCGDDPASATYVRGKGRAAERLGIRFRLHRPTPESTTADLVALLAGLNTAPDVDAILVQLPLPRHVDQDAVIDAVDPAKDADGFHPVNLGRLGAGRTVLAPPCTPAGCLELLRRSEVPVAGSRAVVIGRSTIVGRPLAMLLTNADATVTVAHSRTRELAALCAGADILVSAMGRPGMITAEYVHPGACVIDVGTTHVEGRVTGDVDRQTVEPVAGWLTPVPGGVGPMTIAMLMRNTVRLAAAVR